MRNNEVMFGIHRCLQVVADNSGAATTAVHGPGVRIGQRYLMIWRSLDLCSHLLQKTHLPAQARDLFPDLINSRLWDVAHLAVGTIECGKVALNAGLDLLDPLARLVFCVVPIPIVHRFELAPVDCNGRLPKQAQLSAQHHKPAADRPDCVAIVPSKVGDRFEVRCQSTGQPHQFDVALRLALQSPARLDTVQIAVEIDLEHRRRMVGRAPGLGGRRSGKTQSDKIELVDKGLDHPDRVVLGHVIIKRGRQQKILPAIFPLNETAHPKASRKSEKTVAYPRVFTQPRPDPVVHGSGHGGLLLPKADFRWP